MKRIAISTLLLLCFIVSFGQLNMTQLGHLPYNQNLSDIWGYVDEFGNEYALVGAYNGFSIVDVTNPESLQEVFFEQGVSSIWRDVKTWGDYAYVSTEGGNGILIVDLSPLPGEITTSVYYTGSTYPFTTVHNIYVDENGKLYIFGANNGSGGAIICDLNIDPMNPLEQGRYDNNYLHDGMARGDTLWGGAIYNGQLVVVDVSTPSSPELIGAVNTPNNFTHNAWVSDDGSHVFTTDEIGGAFIAAYDVTDMGNITETDRVQSSPGDMVIPHNAHVKKDFIVTSYYTDGVVVHDAERPGNLIEVAYFDTSPNFDGDGYNGCWGAYPFLPSGNILASDMQEGLYVLGIDYKRACYVEGTVTDSVTGLPINDVTVTILSEDISTSTGLDGMYAFGTPLSGVYDIEFAHPFYQTMTLENVELLNGKLSMLDVQLSILITGVHENISEENIQAYPNPFATTIKLAYQFNESMAPDASLAIYDLNGRLIEEISLQSKEGTMQIGDTYKSGTYIVRINNGNEVLKPQLVTKR